MCTSVSLFVFFLLCCVCNCIYEFFHFLYEASAGICCQPIKNCTHIDAIDWFYFSIQFWRHVLMCIGGGAIFIASYIYYRPQLFQTSLNLTHNMHTRQRRRRQQWRRQTKGSEKSTAGSILMQCFVFQLSHFRFFSLSILNVRNLVYD